MKEKPTLEDMEENKEAIIEANKILEDEAYFKMDWNLISWVIFIVIVTAICSGYLFYTTGVENGKIIGKNELCIQQDKILNYNEITRELECIKSNGEFIWI